MTLEPGSKLGPYEITSRIGAGGMGEVWKARDPRLNRDVAIKTSLVGFGGRFQKEAQAIAALNHPNICTLYDVGPDHLVMEYIEGLTLAERIKQGPIPLDEALNIAGQIAAALEAAHEKTIVHRDLKPANIKLRPDGSVKVLDFGLARTGEPSSDTDGNSPTLLSMPTQAGAIMGTAGYMSPEQTRGQTVDKRTDIWAFGVVLYEMLTAQRLFDGATVSDALASVLKTDPDLTVAPRKVRRLLQRCLEKDPRKRLRDIGDYPQLLDETTESSGAASVGFRKMPWALAALFGVAMASLAVLHFTERPAPLPSLRFDVVPPEGVAFNSAVPRAAISPDGALLAFNAVKDGKVQMWVRRLDSTDARPLPGTEGSETPFWSPDSRSVGFFADKKLKRVEVSSGAVQILCGAPENDAGGAWSPDGRTILFSGRNPLTPVQRVAANGGSPVPVLRLGPKEDYQRWPRFLPDGKHFIYFSAGKAAQDDGIFAGSVDGGEPKRILSSPSHAEFAGGYLFYRVEEALVARSFDPVKLEFRGEPVQILPGVGVLPENGRVAFSVSSNGYLAFAGGGDRGRHLAWRDRTGKQLSLLGQPGDYSTIALSPDGHQLAFSSRPNGGAGGTGADIWVFDLVREIPTRITFGNASNRSPVWSADGRSVLFASFRGGTWHIYTKSASGLGEEQLVYPSITGQLFLMDVSPDGRFLLFSRNATGLHDIYALPLLEKAEPIAVERSSFDKFSASFSPDGHYMAWASNESGKAEVYVRSFPGNESKVQISTGGGMMPRWRRDGKELYYVAADGALMAVPVKSLSPFDPGMPVRLFQSTLLFGLGVPGGYIVSADGSRFLLNQYTNTSARAPITIVQNWQAALKK